MLLPTVVLALLLSAAGPGGSSSQSSFECPPGSDHILTKASETLGKAPNFARAEEYCLKALGSKGGVCLSVPAGHYVLWGPNGERLEEGDYIDGRKTGLWASWSPQEASQIVWNDGAPDSSSWKSFGRPTSITIDCLACLQQSFHVDGGAGSTDYGVLGAEGDTCRLSYAKTADGYEVLCSVPRKLGVMSFSSRAEGIDFSSLKPFIREVREGELPVPIEIDPMPELVIEVEELPRPIKTVVPAYPGSGRGVTGTVLIQTLIGRDGRVKEMRVAHSLPGFDEAAKAALRQWIFTPALKEGTPVPVWVVIPFRFKPPDK